MELSHEQQELVANHLYILADILKYSVRANENVQGLGHDDLYQQALLFLLSCHLVF